MGYSGRYKTVKPDTYKPKDQAFSSGFYYDSQLQDPYLSMSLHANRETKDGGKTWNTWSGEHLEDTGNGGHSSEYGRDPIARCILTEDFVYSIANNWSDYNGGNPIESMFESFKPYAPILDKLGENLAKGAADVNKANDFGGALVAGVNKYAQMIAPWMRTAGKYLNKALMVQGTRFSYYNGTQFNFNNMEMKFIAFSDYVNESGNTWTFQSVEDYIDKIKPYVIGHYDPVTNLTSSDDANKFISEYVGFQSPPGGFEMDTKNLENSLMGTLRLNIGGMWALDNLVIKNMNVSMSKIQAKHPEKEGEVVPLYAEIALQLAPASMIVDTGYNRIIQHNGMKEIQDAVKSSYTDKMKEIKDNSKSKLNSPTIKTV